MPSRRGSGPCTPCRCRCHTLHPKALMAGPPINTMQDMSWIPPLQSTYLNGEPSPPPMVSVTGPWCKSQGVPYVTAKLHNNTAPRLAALPGDLPTPALLMHRRRQGQRREGCFVSRGVCIDGREVWLWKGGNRAPAVMVYRLCMGVPAVMGVGSVGVRVHEPREFRPKSRPASRSCVPACCCLVGTAERAPGTPGE